MRKVFCGCEPEPRRAAIAVWSDFCAVPPSPELKERLKTELAQLRATGTPLAGILALSRLPRKLGFNDGVIIPPEQFPLGTSRQAVASAAVERAPLRGTVRVIVVLVDYSDKPMTQSADHFRDLFFSTGKLPHGSVKEYYREVTGGLIDLSGEVVGPFRLPQTLAWYANNNFGIGRPSGDSRANIMANDAAAAADASVNFGLYDNDGNGFVDAFIVVHAGGGGEQTGHPGDIWSHKWTLPSARTADGKQIFAYLTIPEDCRIGVCAHELGHLLFGFPDLYDTDDTSEGVGNWCLMGGGSWNGGGDIPAHPSAWCKVQQGWATTTNVTAAGTITIPDVKASRNVHRLWKDGGGGPEYFLLENRQRTGYDQGLPGAGLLIWHVDESQPSNTDETHYKVGLVQADGKRDLERAANRGDEGDPYPGGANNTAFTGSSTPNSNSFGGQPTLVSVTSISASGPTMSAVVRVSSKGILKETKDNKEGIKEFKDARDKTAVKDAKDRKEVVKENIKEIKDSREKSIAKEVRDIPVLPPGGGAGATGSGTAAPGGGEDALLVALSAIEHRLEALEASLGAPGGAEPFIGADRRPDLPGGAERAMQPPAAPGAMHHGDRAAKFALDAPQP
jgi:immune inhibitor A